MAHFDASFMRQTLDIPRRQRESDVHFRRQSYDLKRDLEVAEGEVEGHLPMLVRHLHELNRRCLDGAFSQSLAFLIACST